jgi:hypothetical protein
LINGGSSILVTDGVCHIYVDKYADLKKAEAVVVDAKVDYAAACNAMVSKSLSCKLHCIMFYLLVELPRN